MAIVDGDESVELPDAARQDIRLAVVLNGGVSLAVWISGVVLELHRLVQASRRPDDEPKGQDPYAQLLDLLGARARIDVIAGTSAGGLNGGFLSLGLVHGCSLDGLRDLWVDLGGLGDLLRDPRQKDAPSLLRGDYFHDELARAYRTVLSDASRGHAAPDGETVDLFLTGTLWQGRRQAFADDMGRRIVETDYDATFHFSSDPEIVGTTKSPDIRGDLRQDGAIAAQLAVASRCTSSFPGAFEPYWVAVEPRRSLDRWQSRAGRANFADSQFVVDGGILRNKPIRPAIDTIYRQSAGQQVRRILAYVVPDPGEASIEPPGDDSPPPTAPHATDVVLGAMTRLRSTDSVADELEEIQRRNEETRHRRRTRDRLAATLLAAAGSPVGTTPGDGSGPPPTDVVGSAYRGYREVRRESAAQTVARLLLSTPGDTRWSRREISTVLRDLAEDDELPFVPPPDLAAALDAPAQEWRWGQSVVGRLGDLVIDVLKRGVWLAALEDPHRRSIVERRESAHRILKRVRIERVSLDDFWRGQQGALPARGLDVAASPDEIAALRTTLARIVPQWDGADSDAQGSTRARLRGQAIDFASCLLEARDALTAIAGAAAPAVDPTSAEQRRLADLVTLLLAGAGTADEVLRRMLRLEVLHVAFAGVTAHTEQEAELVQISSLRPDLLTGVQLHHFGAFYRASWRANDWMRGRLDGSEQLVQMLLAPERLRQLRHTARTAFAALHKIAVGPADSPRHAELTAAWEEARPGLLEELAVLDGTEPLPRTFPRCAARITHRLRVSVLEEELVALAGAIRTEPDPVEDSTRWAADVRTALPGTQGAPLATVGRLDGLLTDSKVVGRQRIAGEALLGTDTFARTVTHAGATLSSTVTTKTAPKALGSVLAAFRGYALLLWVFVGYLSGRTTVGRHAVSIAVGVGGALIGVALVVPGVPVGVPLLGVGLVLAAAVAATSVDNRTDLGRRLAVALVLLLLVLAAIVVQRVLAEEDAWEFVLTTIGRIAVVAAVVLLGVYLARSKPRAGD